MKTIQPRNGLVLVAIVPHKEHKTEAGIIVPVTQGTIFEIARIVAVGPGTWDAGKQCGTQDLKAGQVVLIKSGMQGQQLGQTAMLGLPVTQEDGSKVVLMNQSDVFAIINDDGKPGLRLTLEEDRQLAVVAPKNS